LQRPGLRAGSLPTPTATGIIDRAGLWIAGTGALALPLIYTPAISDAYVLPKLLWLRLIVLALAGLWLARAYREGRLTLRRTALDVPLTLIVLAAFASTLLAVNRNVAIWGTYERYEGLLTILSYVALFWLLTQTIDRTQARTLLRCLLLGAYIASLVAITQSIFGSLVGGGNLAETAFRFAGLARAQGTMGNPNLLAALLAMMLPVAVDDALAAHQWRERVVALTLALPMGLALLLTFGRGAWVGAAIGTAITLIASMRQGWRIRLGVLTLLAGVAAFGLLAVAAGHGGLSLGGSIVDRLTSIASPATGSGATRLHVWRDTINLVASRPLIGYGPDTFGLVYPRFETGVWTPGYLVDKAHSEVLQLAATQGLVGVLGFAAMLIAIAWTFWKGRRVGGAVAILAGVIAYQVQNQVNFSWLPAAAPFWIFLACAILQWSSPSPPATMSLPLPRAGRRVVAALMLVLPVAVVFAVILPYLADAAYGSSLRAEGRGDTVAAAAAVDRARQAVPYESTYAVEAGHLAFMHGDLGSMRKAAAAYADAARLGTANPAAYRNLALADRLIGDNRGAVAAARRAIELDPSDGAGAAILQTVTGS
jgi:O-antigen ligase